MPIDGIDLCLIYYFVNFGYILTEHKAEQYCSFFNRNIVHLPKLSLYLQISSKAVHFKTFIVLFLFSAKWKTKQILSNKPKQDSQLTWKQRTNLYVCKSAPLLWTRSFLSTGLQTYKAQTKYICFYQKPRLISFLLTEILVLFLAGATTNKLFVLVISADS